MQPSEVMDVSLQLLAGSNSSPISTATNTPSSTCSSLSHSTPNSNTNSNTSVSNNTNEYFPSAGTMTHSAQSGMSSTEEEAVTSDNVHRLWKRKYHRHAKPDTNAPLKPPSAYVMFSNDVRAELKQQNKSFTDLAKIIGDRWKNISPEEKESYEVNALKSREEYLTKLEEYHKTDSFKVISFFLHSSTIPLTLLIFFFCLFSRNTNNTFQTLKLKMKQHVSTKRKRKKKVFKTDN